MARLRCSSRLIFAHWALVVVVRGSDGGYRPRGPKSRRTARVRKHWWGLLRGWADDSDFALSLGCAARKYLSDDRMPLSLSPISRLTEVPGAIFGKGVA